MKMKQITNLILVDSMKRNIDNIGVNNILKIINNFSEPKTRIAYRIILSETLKILNIKI